MTEAPPKSPVDVSLRLPPDLDPRGRPRARRTDAARGRARRALVVMAATLSCLVFVAATGGYTVYRYFDGQISRIKLNLGGDRPTENAGGAVNFLLVGSDSRAGTGSQFESEGAVDGERSDTTMIANLAPDGTTTLVSFPRDTLVSIPGHGRSKLNSAITTGGPSLLIRTIERMTGIRIDHYVSVDLDGFRRMTNAIGGVTVCLRQLPDGSTANLRDPWSQWRGVVGANHIDGEQALAFVRQRHGLPNGDFDRIHRQQQFIGAVFEKATSTGVLANPARLEGLLQAALSSLTVDDSTKIDDLQRLATRLRGLSADQIRFETIPVRPPTPAEGANALGELPVFGSVQIYDPSDLDAFLAPLRGERAQGSSPTATAGPGGIPKGPASPRSGVRVNVYNGTGVAGTGDTTAASLARAGFETGAARTWTGGSLATSQVRYAPGREADARAVAAVVPEARVAVDSALRAGTVTLILGTGFTGLDRAAIAANAGSGTSSTAPGAAGAAGTDSPAPAAPPRTASDLTTSCTY
ncbi:LCP family protein [Pseudofrankia asymbiotica]|uniref:Transcriptional regulator n=1 Tax=Pseudofrankia asymbiotica TaxID=1834516 RepID=A0A1V2IGD9_9ACTN|nr:LCP family protein [Pseudofrankia asymbiotica]ONH32273.1 transcriptional regulator [Pseudofrankia asymbiotica]